MEPTEGSRVLVVDDEPQITRVLRTVLLSQGYQVRTATEGEMALTSFREWSPELVITDLYMPHMDGLELCRRIRALSTVPIIVLSVKGEERTKVEALDSGADDYVTKPFGIDELMARVRAALRRRAGAANGEPSAIELGDFRIDLDARRVHAHGLEVRLTPKEFDLFVYMARRPNRVLTQAAQEARARSVEPEVSDHRAVGRVSVFTEGERGLGAGGSAAGAEARRHRRGRFFRTKSSNRDRSARDRFATRLRMA
jgi:two-component system KDP operon response regulator KdpE